MWNFMSRSARPENQSGPWSHCSNMPLTTILLRSVLCQCRWLHSAVWSFCLQSYWQYNHCICISAEGLWLVLRQLYCFDHWKHSDVQSGSDRISVENLRRSENAAEIYYIEITDKERKLKQRRDLNPSAVLWIPVSRFDLFHSSICRCFLIVLRSL